MSRAVIAMGSNLGDRLENLQGGLDALFDAPGLTFVAVSPVFETAPVGGPPQPAYLNAVLIAETALPARAVHDRCHSVEAALQILQPVPQVAPGRDDHPAHARLPRVMSVPAGS